MADYNESMSGGVIVGGATILTRNYTEVMSGGVTAGGTNVPGGEGTLIRVLPVLTGTLTGDSGQSGVIAGSFAAISATLQGGQIGLNGRLPAFTGTISALSGSRAVLDARLPSLSGSISATLGTSGSVVGRMAALAGQLSGVSGSIGVIAGSLYAPTAILVAQADGVLGSLSGRLAAIQGALSGAEQIAASLHGRLPVVGAWLTAPATAGGTVVVTLVMNTVSTNSTEYGNYAFNSYTRLGDTLLAADSNGIYLLDTSELDEAALIPFSFTTPKLLLGGVEQKRISDFYAWLRSELDIQLTIAVDEDQTGTVTIPRTPNGGIKARRVVTPKGLRGTYWQFTLSGQGGVEIDKLLASVAQTPRKV